MSDPIVPGDEIIEYRDIQPRRIDIAALMWSSGPDDPNWFDLWDEYETLGGLQSQIEDVFGKSADGFTPNAIHCGHFTEAMRKEADSIGFIDTDSPVDSFVDWDAYADHVRSDYATVEFGGVTYYVRG